MPQITPLQYFYDYYNRRSHTFSFHPTAEPWTDSDLEPCRNIDDIRILEISDNYGEEFFIDCLQDEELELLASIIASNKELETIEISLHIDHRYEYCGVEELMALAKTLQGAIQNVSSSRRPIRIEVHIALDPLDSGTFEEQFLQGDAYTTVIEICLQEFVVKLGAADVEFLVDKGDFFLDASFFGMLENHLGASTCLRRLEIDTGYDIIQGDDFPATSLVAFLVKQKSLQEFCLITSFFVDNNERDVCFHVTIHVSLSNDDFVFLQNDGAGRYHEITRLLAVSLFKKKVSRREFKQLASGDPVLAMSSLLSLRTHSGYAFLASKEIKEINDLWHQSCCNLARYVLEKHAIMTADDDE